MCIFGWWCLWPITSKIVRYLRTVRRAKFHILPLTQDNWGSNRWLRRELHIHVSCSPQFVKVTDLARITDLFHLCPGIIIFDLLDLWSLQTHQCSSCIRHILHLNPLLINVILIKILSYNNNWHKKGIFITNWSKNTVLQLFYNVLDCFLL